MEAEFSKKMYQRLTEYETYIKETCKSPLLQKDKVQVDKEELLALITDLKAFHGVDQQLDENGELDFGTVQMTKEQMLKNALWQALANCGRGRSGAGICFRNCSGGCKAGSRKNFKGCQSL